MPDMPEEVTVETAEQTHSTTGFSAPYIPFKTLTNLIQRMAEEGMPDRIDRTYLGTQSGTMQTYLIKTLQSFGLIEGEQGEVTDALRDLVANPDERPTLIGNLVRQYYPEALALGPGATHGQLEEVFTQHYGVAGDTRRKAITFFLHAAKFAGITLSRHFKMPRASSGATKTRGAGSRRVKRQQPPADPAAVIGSPRSMDALRSRYVEMLMKKAESDDELDPDLLDRIESLLGFEPADGTDEEEPED